jgi:predicted DNA-binding transcriptional regulator AlpA
MKAATAITPREQYLSVRFMTTGQICEELGVTRTSLLAWRQAGMPYIPLGTRCVRYNLHDVLGWLEQRKTVSRAS